MDWTEVMITVPAEDVERAGDIAQMVVPYGIYIEDYSHLEEEAMEIAHVDLIDEDLLAKDRSKGIVHIYLSPDAVPAEALAFLSERYNAEKISHEITTTVVQDADWANEWKKYFQPLEIGEHLVICPSWVNYENTDNRKVLSIDPGMAFGTGGHTTTRLCLENMEEYITPETTVLDLGCGSGILSIAALLYGAKNATGVDIDALAVKTAIENGTLNGFSRPEYHILQGNLADKVTGTYDVVVANIIADVIALFCKSVKHFMKPDGVFITSGIIHTREEDVLDAFAQNGLTVISRREEDGWLSFICKK